MKLNLPLIKAIALITAGSSIYCTGSQLSHKPSAIAASAAGMGVLAFGMVKTIHELEQKDKAAYWRKRARFWETQASRQFKEKKKYWKQVQELEARVQNAKAKNMLYSDIDEEYIQQLEKAEMN